MTKRADELLEAAMLLSEEERLEISERLYRSVAPPGDLDLGPEWAVEIARRLRDHRDGTAQSVPADEAIRMIGDGEDDPQPGLKSIPWEEARLVIRKRIGPEPR